MIDFCGGCKPRRRAMLRWRLLLGTLIIAALVGLGWMDARSAVPGAWLTPALLAFVLFSTQEILRLARAGGARPLGWAVYAGNLLLAFSPFVASLGAFPDTRWVLGVALLLVFVGEMVRYEKPDAVFAAIAAAALALVYVGAMLALAVQLRLTWGLGALAAWIITVKMGDTGAYTVGRLIGRHKLCPRLSPGKTVEGAFGALAFAYLASWASFTWLVPLVPHPAAAMHRWGWLPFGLLLALAGMAGDLAESLLKRDVGAKDSSAWMPGFGGVLDILDSLLLSVPVAWLCWSLGWVGA